MPRVRRSPVFAFVLIVAVLPGIARAADPVAVDTRLAVELFAEHPAIVTPTGLAVDSQGRVFVAESHTHFRPDDYDGPLADRILMFVDSDADGRADQTTIFHEGFVHVMDIEFHHDGSLYVATRRDIHRLRDTDGDGRADETTRIVQLETAGNYPHNGLSGLAFDLAGDLNFGLGENLGADYKLNGADGSSWAGGGEGGSTYFVRADGSQLRRTSTGWWNPYGMCVDAFGRLFGTDNDPDASPPCRLIQVIEGADYGYEFRYGRSGRNPLITWNGRIPGTLPMISGTGEAPCAIVAYESDALPGQFRGNLLVPSWADHRIENYAIEPRADQGLVGARRGVLVQGSDDFRPVGIDVAPDGSVYISDWVSSSYSLHKQGRVWRIRSKVAVQHARPTDPRQALFAVDRRTRDAAARKLAADSAGRQFLAEQVRKATDDRVRAVAMQALTLDAGDAQPISTATLDLLRDVAGNDASLANRVLAAQLGGTSPEVLNQDQPLPVVAAALLSAAGPLPPELLAWASRQTDPVVVHAAVMALAHRSTDVGESASPLVRLLAAKRNRQTKPQSTNATIRSGLASEDDAVLFTAVKWISDDKLIEHRAALASLLDRPRLDFGVFLAATAALGRLDGNKPQDRPATGALIDKIVDDKASPTLRRFALQLIDPLSPALKLDQLEHLANHADATLRMAAVRTLASRTLAGSVDDASVNLLSSIADAPDRGADERAHAINGLAPVAESRRERLIELTLADHVPVRDAALRALVGVALNANDQRRLRELAQRDVSAREAVRRLIDKSPAPRPAKTDTAGWSMLLDAQGDPAAGRHVFFDAKIGTCARCHSIEGRGQQIGPDLSEISARIAAAGDHGRDWLLETLLQPSKEMAPHFTPWQIVTKDGKTLLGLPRTKGGKRETYLGIDGREFAVQKADIEFHQEAQTSIMPEGLLQQLTRKELNDLVAFILH